MRRTLSKICIAIAYCFAKLSDIQILHIYLRLGYNCARFRRLLKGHMFG